jgi:D-alanine-D-alanine ligase
MATMMRQPLTVQEFVRGYEIDVPVYCVPRAFAPMAVGVSVSGARMLGDDFLDYDMLDSRSYAFFPFSEVSLAASMTACRVAERAAEILGIRGYGRIDFRVDEAGIAYLIDMQTMPDIFDQSSVYYALASSLVQPNEVYPALIAINCKQLGLFNVDSKE